MESPTAVELAPEPLTDTAYRDRGSTLLREGKFSEAAAALESATKQNPDDEASWRLLGGALASNGAYSTAVTAFERAVALAPANARNHYNLGVALQGEGRESEARAAMETSLRIDPSYQQARARLTTLSPTAPAIPVTPPLEEVRPQAAPASLGGMATIGFSSGSSALVTPAQEAPAPPAAHPGGMPTLGAIGGGMQGLGSLGGGNVEPAPQPVAPIVPSQATPQLRQPVVAPYSPPTYNPSSPHGGNSYGDVPASLLRAEQFANSSGMQGDVPDDVARGFNFGAAVITFWWLRNHNLRPVSWGIAGMYFILRIIGQQTGSSAAWIILLCVQIAMFFGLGFMGNRLGWQNRRFDDVEDFKSCQRIWMFWAIPVLLLQLAMFFVGASVGSPGGTHHIR